MTSTNRITRGAYLEALEEFRNFLKQRCLQHPGVTDEILYDVQLAVDEACTNIVTHGYAGMDPGSIILDLELAPDKLVITITDFGHSFEPDSVPTPEVDASIEERELGGFGLYFIYQSMDDVQYKITEDGNVMQLTKYIRQNKTQGERHAD